MKLKETTDVDKLTNVLIGNSNIGNGEYIIPLMYAEIAIKAGYIHKSTAVEYCIVCPSCMGFGEINDGDNCPTCQGKGIILKEE